MDLAIHSPAISVKTENPKSAVTYSKSILLIGIDNQAGQLGNPEHVFFANVSLSQAIDRLQQPNASADAVLIHPESVAPDVERLRDVTRAKAIPLILYTPTYDTKIRKVAFSIAADDYVCGAISAPLFKRLDSLKKLKAYKNARGNKPYTIRHADDIPHIKLWSMKRAFDIVVSATALFFLLPLCLLIALIVKLESRGPIFYISKRAGTGYKIFDFYKFRTMHQGADTELATLAHLNQYNGNGAAGVFFKIKDDPRITPFGQFLRNTSLDEIPQLFNVLRGDMSLVGNRPLPLYEAEKLTCDQIAWRFLAPAGITGLWQITKRGKENMSPEERIALDMEYAMNNSFWLDMKILLSTFPALLQKEKV